MSMLMLRDARSARIWALILGLGVLTWGCGPSEPAPRESSPPPADAEQTFAEDFEDGDSGAFEEETSFANGFESGSTEAWPEAEGEAEPQNEAEEEEEPPGS